MDYSLIGSLVAIGFLLIVSAFFSGSETSLTAASRARMHYLDRHGNSRARVVNRLREHKERLIGGILLGNNLVNILASAIATEALISAFGDVGVVYATIVMTASVLIFGEVLPKTYAIRHPDRMALALGPPVEMVIAVLAPVTQTIQAIVNLILRLVGERGGTIQGLVPPTEEIRSSIALHAAAGGIVKHQRDMLASILDLGEMQVADVMIHRKAMEMISIDQPPDKIVSQALGSKHTRLPLWRNHTENIVGVLHARDLLRALATVGYQPERLDIAAIATAPWFVPETTTLREQLNAFRRQRAHFALVVDEYGALMGLVTLEDIIEDIVGEFREDRDAAIPGVRRLGDGACIVTGTVTIRDLNRQFDWRLPDEEATTIAGLVIHEARMIPEVGQVFVFHGFKFEILRRQRHQITQLRMTPLTSAAPSAPESPAAD